jgi:hypothetical protein
MTFSTYINGVPLSANVGDTIVARIKPLCMNQTTAYVSYGTGSRGADESRDEITREVSYSKTATCDEEFEMSFVVTEAMEQAQLEGRENGVYATEDGDITTAYFSVASSSDYDDITYDDIVEMVIENKELIILGTVAGIIVMKYM